MYCRHCGTRIDNPEARFCPVCGNTVTVPQASEPVGAASTTGSDSDPTGPLVRVDENGLLNGSAYRDTVGGPVQVAPVSQAPQSAQAPQAAQVVQTSQVPQSFQPSQAFTPTRSTQAGTAVQARRGMDVLAEGLVRYRGRGRKRRITTDNVSLHIRPNEFVSIIGASGSGKSTLLNELDGSEPADEGRVYVDGIDLYANYEALRGTIGFVPQEDIVYDNLTLTDMLGYAAELRMPDATIAQRKERVAEVISQLQLQEVAGNLIGNMSGGQKKRASIGVELLADPRLLFLDEPTSGLDPNTERLMMELLSRMAHEGRTIVVVTHTTTNLHLCDKVIILGTGGKLCYFGDADKGPAFFGEESFINVYGKIEADPDGYAQKFAAVRTDLDPRTLVPKVETLLPTEEKVTDNHQFKTLFKRYVKLILNDHSRLALLILQAPLLAWLIAYVAGENCFVIYEDTKSCLFALSCAAFWVGILDSIQEICKERSIFNREYEGGLRITSYVASKVAVLGLLCIIQSLIITIVFCIAIPDGRAFAPDSIFGLPVLRPVELFFCVALVTLSAMCLGLAVSALFKNPDRAIAMAPLLIMPQILFSGVVVELKDAILTISNFITCRWGMQSMGICADLNSLDLGLCGQEITYEHQQIVVTNEMNLPRPEIDATIFAPNMLSMLTSWSVLLLSCIICIALCVGLLSLKTRRKK